jgi:glycosyltransferase involved in cell wall biosynthesis
MQNALEGEEAGGGFARRLIWKAVGAATRLSFQASGEAMVVSEALRRELARRFSTSPAKFVVVPHGVSEQFRPLVEGDPGAALRGRDYSLVVSDLYPHKNVHRVVAAWERVRRSHPDMILALVGHPVDRRYAAAVAAQIRKLGLEKNVLLLGGRRHEDLPPIYSRAKVALCLSQAESFGMTQLEAMACGCPVVASDLPFAREVSADAALFVPFDDIDAIANGVLRILQDPGLAAELRRRGLERVRHYTWDATARAVHEYIRRRIAQLEE